MELAVLVRHPDFVQWFAADTALVAVGSVADLAVAGATKKPLGDIFSATIPSPAPKIKVSCNAVRAVKERKVG